MTDQKRPSLIPQRIIPGVLAKENQQALGWGCQGLIAYGCQNTLVIVDPNTLQIVQSLSAHNHPICLVKWARENYHHDIASPYSLRLASADTQGKIVVWDAGLGTHQAVFTETGKTVEYMEWLSSQDASVDLMVAIHNPNVVVLWNADTGMKLWKKTYDNVLNLRSLSFDPFDLKNLAFIGSDCILFVHDFAINCEPKSDGKKFYMTLDRDNKNSSLKNTSTGGLASVGKAALTGFRLLMGDERPKVNEVALMECLQLAYLPSYRHHLAAVFPKEILILDVTVLQAVSSIPVERSGSPFLRVFPSKQRNTLFCIHENGSVSLRFQKYTTLQNVDFGSEHFKSQPSELLYESACHSESFRVTNKMKPCSGALCPVSETSVAVIISDGRIFIWNLNGTNEKEIDLTKHSSHYNPPKIYSQSTSKKFCNMLKNCMAPNLQIQQNNICEPSNKISLHFTLTGSSSECISSPITCIRMCPPLTHKNWPHYHPLIAIGLYNGNIQVFNLSTGHLVREISVHTCQVRGIEWSGLQSFVSYGYVEPSSVHMTNVANELKLTDLYTGKTVPLREGKGSESPIQFVRMSYQRQYLIIVFQSKPFELWDVKARQLLREISSNKLPIVCALEWAPGHTTKKSKSDFLEEVSGNILTKEHLVLTDSASKIYHCIAESSSFRLGSCIPNGNDRGSAICSITWKGDHLLMGDSDGTLTVWDLQAKLSRSVSTYKGTIKKAKFGPGKGNLKVLILYEDGVDLWDAKKIQCISTLKKQKIPSRVIDIDWCASESPVLAFANSQVYVTSLDLKVPASPNSVTNFHSFIPIHCPYFLPSKSAFVLKASLLYGELKNITSPISTPNENQKILKSKIESLQSRDKMCLNEKDTLTRSTCVARIFGDESEIKFWTVLANSVEKDNDKASGIELGILGNNELFRLSEIQRSKRHISLRHSEAQDKKCVRDLILLGQTDHAIQLSLETEAHHKTYYQDSLKVCLLTSLNCNPESAQSTVKLVATNLIANGKLFEGVELLCMINKPYDACRYLTSSGEWNLAVWLAKVRLDDSQYEDIMLKWAVHLSSPHVNQKSNAILVYLSLKKYEKVLETLYQMRYFDRAAIFADICCELKLLEKSEKITSLIEMVYTEYARFLHGLGCSKTITDHYCNKGGKLGLQLLNDIENSEIASDDTTNSKDWSVIASSNSSVSDEYEKVKGGVITTPPSVD